MISGMTTIGAKRPGVRQPSAAFGMAFEVVFPQFLAASLAACLGPCQSGVAASLCHRTPRRFACRPTPLLFRAFFVPLLFTACALHAQFPGVAWERLSDADSKSAGWSREKLTE